jgi:hypothetical protein
VETYKLQYDNLTVANSLVSGVRIELMGVDQFGANITKSTQSTLGSNFAFSDLAPGNYEIIKEALPFLNDLVCETHGTVSGKQTVIR